MERNLSKRVNFEQPSELKPQRTPKGFTETARYFENGELHQEFRLTRLLKRFPLKRHQR